MRRLAVCCVLVVALLPMSVNADEEASAPQLTCQRRALRVMAAEVSGVRLECTVSGAQAEQAFTIELEQGPADVAEVGAPPLGQRSVCSATLTDGAGACVGSVFNLSSPAFGETRVTARLMPSGQQLEDATSPPAVPPPAGGQ